MIYKKITRYLDGVKTIISSTYYAKNLTREQRNELTELLQSILKSLNRKD